MRATVPVAFITVLAVRKQIPVAICMVSINAVCERKRLLRLARSLLCERASVTFSTVTVRERSLVASSMAAVVCERKPVAFSIVVAVREKVLVTLARRLLCQRKRLLRLA